MSLDKLLIIFIIIILPIAFVLNTYVNMQADTLKTQALYDAKLYSATNDALKAYQENAFNEVYSNLAEPTMRNVDASSQVFFNALANNFNMQGYSKETLQSHVPAIAFTMYDGMYICSKYENNFPYGLPEDDHYGDSTKIGHVGTKTYNPIGDVTYGVKPYIYYCCRYKRGSDDFTIIYSMENYIAIQGVIDGKWVNDSGYVIDPTTVTAVDPVYKTLKYRDTIISKEQLLQEYVGTTLYPYVKVKGVKHYRDDKAEDYNGNITTKWFTIGNHGEKNYTNDFSADNLNGNYDLSAYNYYLNARDFTLRLKDKYKLTNLTPAQAVVFHSNKEYYDEESTFYVQNFKQTNQTAKIFGDFKDIEEKESNFNEHRLAVIRYTIERTFSIAIGNFNTYSSDFTEFQMPELRENEWELILNNISIISFMQGLPIGTKMYNGLAIVQNNKNGDMVNENSLYMVKMPYRNYVNAQGTESVGSNPSETLYYYDVRKKYLYKNIDYPVGILNVDLERRYMSYEDKNGDYFYPKLYFADYSSIITKTENVNLAADTTDPGALYNRYKYAYNGSIFTYMRVINNQGSKGQAFVRAYYTAVGRERYGGYRSLDF